MLRLWNASGRRIARHEAVQRNLWLSDISERPIEKITGPTSMPAWGMVSVRAEYAE